MNAQQLLDYIVKPALKYMGGGYDSIESRYLMMATAAIESDCGYYIKQIGGPALGIWQMEPDTHGDIWQNCDALTKSKFIDLINNLGIGAYYPLNDHEDLTSSPLYACAMARLKYAMDPKALPVYTGAPHLDMPAFYEVYKRVYNTEHGKSTFDKWCAAIDKHKINELKL